MSQCLIFVHRPSCEHIITSVRPTRSSSCYHFGGELSFLTTREAGWCIISVLFVRPSVCLSACM